MPQLTTRERFTRIFDHKEADRIPVMDDPWKATIERWHGEGLPAAVSFKDYFDLDQVDLIFLDNSPRYEKTVLEDTDTYQITTSDFGVTMRQWKHAESTPEFLKFTIVDPQSWKAAKPRITSSPDRIDWDWLKANYPAWQRDGHWVQAALWFGYDVTASWTVGTQRVLMALVEEPRWLMDMFETMLENNLALLDQVWAAGYRFDSIFWWDDLGYKQHQFFSLKTYRNVLKPFHQRAIDWAHAKGIKAHLHSCGDIRPFVPELISMGLDALNPLEVKAGMDPVALKREFGKDLVFHGGINAVLWDQPDLIRQEMERVVPVMKENGGYIFSSDHSVPSSVSFKDFGDIVALAKKLGTYA
jgi:uroporphyrinogen decarboxylase